METERSAAEKMDSPNHEFQFADWDYSDIFGTDKLGRTEEDLRRYRQRIDANVEQQREHSSIIAGLQNKLAKYRKNLHGLEKNLRVHKQGELPSLVDSGFLSGDAGDVSRFPSGDMTTNYETILTRLEEERRRFDDFRAQIDLERHHNQQLETDLLQIRKQFSQEIENKEKDYKNREKNLLNYLSEEQRKVLELWTELQHLRRQFRTLKEETERELDKQKSDFVRTVRSMKSIGDGFDLNSVTGGSFDPRIQVINRNERTTTTTTLLDLVDYIKRMKTTETDNENNSDIYKDLIKKYEEAVERNIQLESAEAENVKKSYDLDMELKKTRELLHVHENALKRIYELALTNEKNIDTGHRRSRSLSPSNNAQPEEVVRILKNVFRNKENVVSQLSHNLKNCENRNNDLLYKLELIEEVNRSLEIEVNNLKNEQNESDKLFQEYEYQRRRLEDKLKLLESEKKDSDMAHRNLENDVLRLKQQFEKTTIEDSRKAREESEEYIISLENDYKARISDLNQRISAMQSEKRKCNSDLNISLAKCRELEGDISKLIRNLEEKENQLQISETQRSRLTTELELIQGQIADVKIELSAFSRDNTILKKENQELEQFLINLRQKNSDISYANDSNSSELKVTKENFEKIKIESESAINNLILKQEEIEKQNSEIEGLKNQLIVVRYSNDELDTQLKTAQAKQVVLENDVETNKKEVITIVELNERLQREKQELLSRNNDNAIEISQLKEQIRRLDIDFANLQRELDAAQKSETISKEEMIKHGNKVKQLQNELEEAISEARQLKEKIEEMEKDFANRLKNSQWKIKSTANKTSTATKTTTTRSGEEGSSADEQEDSGEVGKDPETIYMLDPEIIEGRINEINEKWKLEIVKLEKEKERLEGRVWELEDQLNYLERTKVQEKREIEESVTKLQHEIDRLNEEITNLKKMHQSELDDEKTESKKIVEESAKRNEELENKLNQIEKRLANALNIQNDLERIKKELNERLENVSNHNQRLKNELEDAKSESDKENQKWRSDSMKARSEIKSLETTISSYKSQINAANERIDNLNKTTNDYVAKIREANSQIKKLEDDISELQSSVVNKDNELVSNHNKIRQLEDQQSQLQIENSKLSSELELKSQEFETIIKTRAQLQNESEKLREQLRLNEETIVEHKHLLEKLKLERDRLHSTNREKTKNIDSLQNIVNQLEEKIEEIRRENREISEKITSSDVDRTTIQSKLTNTEKELQFIQQQLISKNSEYQTAINDLAFARSNAENGRLAALQELENKKYEYSDMESRLSGMDQRMQILYQDYLKVENERDSLNNAVKRFQKSFGRAFGTNYGDELQNNIIILTNGEEKISIDMSQMENSLQKIVDIIEKLRIQRDQYTEELNRIKKKSSEINVVKRESHFKTIEDNLDNAQEEKRSLEAKLITVKRLLKSQEETMKEHEEERRRIKGKLVTAEVETRGKDSQIRHLNEQIKNMRKNLDNANSELHLTREKIEKSEGDRYQSVNKLHDQEAELQQMQVQVHNLELNNINLTEKIKDLTNQIKSTDSKNIDMSGKVEKLIRDLQKSETSEKELKKNLEILEKENRELVSTKEELIRVQSEVSNSSMKKSELEAELSNTRSELRSGKSRLNELNGRTQDLQRQLYDAIIEKNRNGEKSNELDKQLAMQRQIESDLKQKLELLKGEKYQLTKKIDDLEAKVKQLEAEKSTLAQIQKQFKHEKDSLMKRIQLLEAEKRRTDAAIQETVLQREAIEKSLNTMERENRELYKNCAQLQQQINQLEMENGTKLIEITKRQREEHEKQLQRLKIEKAQIENIIENRERVCRQKIQQLEAQCRAIREQLNAERQRNRERRSANDTYITNRFTSGTGYGTHENYWPIGSDNIDSATTFRSFGSHILKQLTPPLGTSTPIHQMSKDEIVIESDESTINRKLKDSDKEAGQNENEGKEERSIESLRYYKGL